MKAFWGSVFLLIVICFGVGAILSSLQMSSSNVYSSSSVRLD